MFASLAEQWDHDAVDRGIAGFPKAGYGTQESQNLAPVQALAARFDAVGVVNHAIEDGVRGGGI